MPANLNALLRYQTIDRLLRTGRKYTLNELIRYCSESLAENRGIYKTISRRTIQDDIRIMRSDILGFNAPIKNRTGYYFYTHKDFSIFDDDVSNFDILIQVFNFLKELDVGKRQSELDHLVKAVKKQLLTRYTENELEERDYSEIRLKIVNDQECVYESDAEFITAAGETKGCYFPLSEPDPVSLFSWKTLLEILNNPE